MESQGNYFLRAGFIAIGFYLLLVLSVLIYLIEPNMKKITSFQRDTAVQLDLTLFDTNELKKTSFEKSNTKQEVQKAEESASKATVTTTNMKSLFANVSVNAQVTKQPTNTNQTVQVASSKKATFEKEDRAEISPNVAQRLENVNLSPVVISSNDGETDEYTSKINELFTTRWYSYNHKEDYNNLSAKVNITIYKNGKFVYSRITSSGNADFDRDLEAFLLLMTNQNLPTPSGDDIEIKMNFRIEKGN